MAQTALVVDPDPMHLASATRMLAQLGYDVLSSSTFEDANRHLGAADSIAILISDVRLGQFNGLHLAFRARARHPGVLVVITYDAYDATLEVETRRLGGVYCRKPLSSPQVAALIERLAHPDAAWTPTQARRWPRKLVGGGLRASVDDREARLRDISYGGVCLEFVQGDFAGSLPPRMDVVLPNSGLSLTIHPVWARPDRSQTAWLCGGEVIAGDQPSLMQWQQFVDACPV